MEPLCVPFVSWPHPEDTHSSKESQGHVDLPPPFVIWLSGCSCGSRPEAELGPSHPDTVEMGLGTSHLSQMGRGCPEMSCQAA